MLADYTDHERWGFVLHKHHSVRLEFAIRDKRDIVKLRSLISKFQDTPVAAFVAMIGDVKTWDIEFPKEYGLKIAAAATAAGIPCRTEKIERIDYLIYDIAAGDLLELRDEAEYRRIVEILKTNGNPIVDVFEF